jgi:subtilisin family serine protease
MRNSSSTPGVYGFDYAAGHGTHVASTVCGSLDPGDGSSFDGTSLDAFSAAELDCSAYLSLCSVLFCTSCDFAHYCDATCGYAFAAGNASVYSGMAPDAQVLGYDVGDADGGLDVPSDLYSMVFAPAYESGARLHTNSWGYSSYYDYEAQCVSTDLYMYDHPDALVLFAAGNDGSDGAGSVGAPAVAKNLLSVGAAETQAAPDTVADFSSFGPTNDQRIKPDVVGPGDPIAAARASGSLKDPTCDVVDMSGTSMATPAVAGAAALVQQFLRESGWHQTASPVGFAGSSYNATAPSGSLIKALLVASAVPVGWGYVGTESTDDDSQTKQRLSAVYEAEGYGTNATVDYHQGVAVHFRDFEDDNYSYRLQNL